MAEDEKEPEDEEKEGADAEGEEGEEGAEGEEGSGKKFNVKKIIMFGVAPLVVLIGLGVGAYFMGFLDSVFPPKPDCAEVVEGDPHYEACAEELGLADKDLPGVFVDIPNLIVNLNSTSRNPHFLKVSLKVELKDAESEKKFNDVLPRVIDQFQTYLRELQMTDLRGSSGLYRMRIELLNRIRAVAPDVEVRDVLFQEILVQ